MVGALDRDPPGFAGRFPPRRPDLPTDLHQIVDDAHSLHQPCDSIDRIALGNRRQIQVKIWAPLADGRGCLPHVQVHETHSLAGGFESIVTGNQIDTPVGPEAPEIDQWSHGNVQRTVGQPADFERRIDNGQGLRGYAIPVAAAQLIESGQLGVFPVGGPDKKNIRLKKKLGGGVLNDAGCYPVCASRILFESEPIGVLSKLFFKKNIDVDLKFSGMLVYSNNRISSMHVGYGLFFQSMYEIWGEHGKISTNRAYNIPPNEKPIVSKFKKIEKRIPINSVDHFQLMIDSFSQEILGKKQSMYNFEEDLLKQAKVMDALRISNKEQRYVKLDELSSD